MVHAAAGGVGLILCQWAKHLGAHRDRRRLHRGEGRTRARSTAPRTRSSATATWRPRSSASPAARWCRWCMTASARTPSCASLDCLAPLGLMVSYGNASGPVPPVDLGMLAAKGSLFLTRPTLATYTAKRADLARLRRGPVRRRAVRRGEDPGQPDLPAEGRRRGARGAGSAPHHGQHRPDPLSPGPQRRHRGRARPAPARSAGPPPRPADRAASSPARCSCRTSTARWSPPRCRPWRALRRRPAAHEPGADLLPAQPRGVHPGQRLDGRPVRLPHRVPRRHRRVHARLRAVRLRPTACRCWSAARIVQGAGRRDDGAGRAARAAAQRGRSPSWSPPWPG